MACHRSGISWARLVALGTRRTEQLSGGPIELLDWEDTLFVETIFECTHCEWSEMIGRNPVQEASSAG